jgi:hypothetical protein
MDLIEEITCWMALINVPMTSRRKQFLRRFQVLLILRGFEILDRRSVQSAMEVILNLRRFPAKQQKYNLTPHTRSILTPHNTFFISYLKAVIKNLDDCIGQLLEMDIDEVNEGVLFFYFFWSRSSPSDLDRGCPR